MRLSALAAVVMALFVGAVPTKLDEVAGFAVEAAIPQQESRRAAGVIQGKILFAGGLIPEPTLIENTTDPQGCGGMQSLENVVISPASRGIRDVIVALKGVAQAGVHTPAVSRITLDNRGCRFRPHVAVLTTGGLIQAVNTDPIFHSVHLYGQREINLALEPQASKQVEAARRPGFLIVKCDIHGWMQAFIRVDDHPFHAVSAADGSFRIEGIPPGFYTLEVWHEYFGQKEVPLEVKASEVSRVSVYYGRAK